MDVMPNLLTALLDLLKELEGEDLKLIIGGGYGVYLKREHARLTGERTLLREWPEARSTNDLDLFLRPELLIDSRKLEPLAASLKRLDYQVIPGAEKYQFAKPGPFGGREEGIKIDLLTGPQKYFAGTRAKVDERRVRPNPSVDLHAHPVDEALTLEDDLLCVSIEGTMSSGEKYKSDVYLPHPLTFTMMKLFAFRDREDDPDKGYGSYHALDIYSVLAMASESEWNRAIELRDKHRSDRMIQEAVHIVDQKFSSLTSAGMLRMRESPYCREGLQLEKFCNALRELFPLSLLD